MTSTSHSPSQLKEHTTNPNPSSAQDEENHHQEQQPTQPSESQPQSPQTLETPDSPNPEQSDLNHPEEDHQQQEQKEEAEAPQFLDQVEQDDHDNPQKSGMTLSPPPRVLQPITDPQVIIDDLNPPPLTSPTNPNRRLNKRKKGGRHIKKQQAIEKKLKTLNEKLNPIPFVPSKVLDFLKHEKLLKGLGLWDFVHIQFDFPTRVDLIAQLIATYDVKSRCGYVNELRVKINRADLARAFKLPVKKEKGNVLEGVDLDSEALSEESISFMEDFVSNWVLLHDDTWMMPSEVLNWTRAIKDGHPEKVDWASVFWFMVEKELTQGEQLEDCYYASHLQYLIKSQRVDLLREEPKVDLEVDMKEEEDGGDVDLKMDGSNDCQGQDDVVLDEPNIELSLGQDIVEKEKEEVKDDDMMDVEECLEEEEENRQWLLDGKNNLGDHFLQPCQLEKGIGSDINEETKQEDEQVEEDEAEEEPEDEFNIPPNDDMLERNGLTGNLLQVMETTQLPFSLQGQLSDPSPVEFVTSRDETHTISAGPSIFGIGSKREIGHEHDISHHSLNDSNKRLRTDGRWDLESSDLGMCMEQAQQWMEKARMAYETKEQTYQDSHMRQQLLLSELQRRDTMMDHMLKTKCEEVQKKNGEIFRLERELYVMGNLLDGYRKALKETNKAFFEYRQQCQLPEEPLYKDAGPGGLILSTTELEKQRQKQEEEDRLYRIMIEQKFKDAEKEYISKFEVYLNKVSMLDDRLMDFENKVKLLKDLSAKPEVSETPGCAPSE